MKTQDTFKFAETHEWASIEDDGLAWIGISNHAQEALGDVMFFQAPIIGQQVKQGEAIAAIESTARISPRCSTSPSAVIKSASVARPVTVPMVSKKSLSNSENTARPAANAPIALKAPKMSMSNSGVGST